MCEPVTIAGVALTATQAMFAATLAVSAVSAATSVYGQQQSAAAQAKYQKQLGEQRNQQILETGKAANKAFVEQSAAENIASGQRMEAASQELQGLQRDRLRTQGTSLATSTAYGLSQELLMGDFLREEARYRDTVDRQLKFDLDESDRRIAGFKAQAESRANSIQPFTPSPIASPNYIGAGLQVIGSGMKAYGDYATKDPDTGEYSLK